MSRIHSILSVAALGLLVSLGAASATSLRVEKENSMTDFKKTFLFGSGRDQKEGMSAGTTDGSVNPIGLSAPQGVNPNPFNIDPEVMRRTTLEARRQVENLVREIRTGGGGTISKGGVDPNYNGIDRPF